jgi:hypothetical protein
MGAIDDRHVEWAVVNRLKKMLDAPPKTSFNVTQSFALFNTIPRRSLLGSRSPLKKRGVRREALPVPLSR